MSHTKTISTKANSKKVIVELPKEELIEILVDSDFDESKLDGWVFELHNICGIRPYRYMNQYRCDNHLNQTKIPSSMNGFFNICPTLKRCNRLHDFDYTTSAWG